MFCRRAVCVFVFTLIIAGLCFLRAGRAWRPTGKHRVGTEFGDPVQGITAQEFELFRLGLEDFTEVENPDEGWDLCSTAAPARSATAYRGLAAPVPSPKSAQAFARTTVPSKNIRAAR